jgi:hypothetical protein
MFFEMKISWKFWNNILFDSYEYWKFSKVKKKVSFDYFDMYNAIDWSLRSLKYFIESEENAWVWVECTKSQINLRVL